LAGLVYYKLGAEGVKNGLRDSHLALAQMRQDNPARAKGLIIGATLTGLAIAAWMFWPSIPATPFGQ
jgi:hypothetical protein